MNINTVILLLFCFVPIHGILPKDLLAVINKFLKSDNIKPNQIQEIYSQFINENDIPRVLTFLIPRVLPWDPYVQFDDLRCPIHNNVLIPGHWRCNSGAEPRWIYDSHGAIVLVTKTYWCKKNHDKDHYYISGEKTITTQLPEHVIVPFKLSHRAAFSKLFQDEIVQRVTSGTNFWTIEEELRSQVFKRYIDLQMKYCYACNLPTVTSYSDHVHSESFPEFSPDFLKYYQPIPSNDYLKEIFIDHFKNYRLNYQQYFTSLSGNILSCNHTFKVSVNIGAINPITKIWTTQYDSLFMVLNENGQVLKYEFVKSTAFDNIQPLLMQIKDSMQNEPDFIVIDNCCHWRKKVNSVFPNTLVKLDLFHAVQRISKHISMKCKYRTKILQDLRLTFRAKNDICKSRSKETPAKNEILSNLLTFMDKWKSIKDHNGIPVFSNQTFKACENLKIHIQRGCLSCIPVGAGTNRNENLHKKLNSSALGIGRIGPELARALLCSLLFAWNCLRDNRNTLKIRYPIENITSVFGRHICFYGLSKIRKDEDDSVHKQKHKTENEFFSENNSNNVDEEESEIVSNTLTFLNFSEKMNKKKVQVPIDSLLWASENMNEVLKSTNKNISDRDTLEMNAKRMNLEIIETSSDGDCLFHAVHFGFRNITVTPNENPVLNKIRSLCSSTANSDYVLELRNIAVNEILNHIDQYQNFITENDKLDILSFKQKGRFSGNNGDLMVQALSNALSIPICIITARTDLEILLVQCRSTPLVEEPIFIGYDHNNSGHYYAMNEIHSIDETHNNEDSAELEFNNFDIENVRFQSTKSCRCGQSRKLNQGTVKSCMKSRCPCFKSKLSCSSRCQCKSCNNSYGKNISNKLQTNNKSTFRKRRQNDLSSHKVSSFNFLKENEEIISQGRWTNVETFLLNEVLKALAKKTRRATSVVRGTTYYNKLVQRVTGLKRNGPLRIKSFNQIQRKISHMKSQKHLLKLLLNQTFNA